LKTRNRKKAEKQQKYNEYQVIGKRKANEFQAINLVNKSRPGSAHFFDKRNRN